MKKTTISLVGLMDLGTLNALKSITVFKNPCPPSSNKETNSSAKLCNIELQDKPELIPEKAGQSVSACL